MCGHVFGFVRSDLESVDRNNPERIEEMKGVREMAKIYRYVNDYLIVLEKDAFRRKDAIVSVFEESRGVLKFTIEELDCGL